MQFENRKASFSKRSDCIICSIGKFHKCFDKLFIQHTSINNFNGVFVCFWRDSPQWARAFSFTRFLDHTQRLTTVGRTPPEEWPACRRDLYLTTHNKHPCPRWDSNPQSQQARASADLRLRPPGHLNCIYDVYIRKYLNCHFRPVHKIARSEY